MKERKKDDDDDDDNNNNNNNNNNDNSICKTKLSRTILPLSAHAHVRVLISIAVARQLIDSSGNASELYFVATQFEFRPGQKRC
jgi:hypothetical protein